MHIFCGEDLFVPTMADFGVGAIASYESMHGTSTGGFASYARLLQHHSASIHPPVGATAGREPGLARDDGVDSIASVR